MSGAQLCSRCLLHEIDGKRITPPSAQKSQASCDHSMNAVGGDNHPGTKGAAIARRETDAIAILRRRVNLGAFDQLGAGSTRERHEQCVELDTADGQYRG